MKLTKTQTRDLAHKIYVALDTDQEDREEHETEEFLNDILRKLESGKLNQLNIKQKEWLIEEADNLVSIFESNWNNSKNDISSSNDEINSRGDDVKECRKMNRMLRKM